MTVSEIGKYRIHYVHKVAATWCRCGHRKYDHYDLHAYGHGPCSSLGCECLDYQAGEHDDEVKELPVNVVENGDPRDTARMLRDHLILGKGARVSSMTRRLVDGTFGGLIAAYVDKWDDAGRLPDHVLALCEEHKP